MGFPSATYPGILDELNRLAFPYRWSTRAIALDKTDAARVLTRIRCQWFAKRKSIMAMLKEVMCVRHRRHGATAEVSRGHATKDSGSRSLRIFRA
jgi:type IV secretory pathway VirB4 component